MNKDVTATLVWRQRWCGGSVGVAAASPPSRADHACAIFHEGGMPPICPISGDDETFLLWMVPWRGLTRNAS
ncbi:MAG: hypothetical protein K5787_10860 [Lentisphaeria bacterium]|nr:hypothetical protein [Lentisphaeria bacterium]